MNELSDTKVYAPQIRARLGTAAHFETTQTEVARTSTRCCFWVRSCAVNELKFAFDTVTPAPQRRKCHPCAPMSPPMSPLRRERVEVEVRHRHPCVGWCYQLGGDNMSVLSAFIILPADNSTANSGVRHRHPCARMSKMTGARLALIGCTSRIVKSFRSRRSFISSPLWTP